MEYLVLSEYDTKHFGKKIARLNPCPIEFIPSLFTKAKNDGIEMVIARCKTSDMATVHKLESVGSKLMDTIVTYHLGLDESFKPLSNNNIKIRDFMESDTDSVIEIAELAFTNYIGHFHNDPKLDGFLCDKLYKKWAKNSYYEENFADKLFVAEFELNGVTSLAGFHSFKIEQETNCRGVLTATHPSFQGKGIYRALLLNSLIWATDLGLKNMYIGTQVNNLKIQKIWTSFGFTISDSYYTFHNWLTEEA